MRLVPLTGNPGSATENMKKMQLFTKRIIVYRKGDIVMEPMNSRDVLPKNVPGVGWGGVGWGVGWGSCRGEVGWGGVG